MSNPKFDDMWWKLCFVADFQLNREILFDFCQGETKGGMQTWETDNMYNELVFLEGSKTFRSNEDILKKMQEFDKEGFELAYDLWLDENKSKNLL
jgi:hypothetical protein